MLDVHYINIDDKKSLVSIDAEAVLAPPVSSGDQEAYIPVEQAKACIQKVSS